MIAILRGAVWRSNMLAQDIACVFLLFVTAVADITK